MKKNPVKCIILDANILIDFLKSDRGVLKLISTELYEICVPSVVLHEVTQLNQEQCNFFKLSILEPSLEELMEAMVYNDQCLSFPDKVCLILSKGKGYICVTNDKRLRQACEQEKVECIWGLQLILLLNQKGKLTKEHATKILFKIHETNKYIKHEIVTACVSKLI
ncbi:MAG: type II toxin-antitoxin system VapC family toxin [Candidatus Auribacter fodinae]|jgi:rRNA-processing protein FCF1|uniref:Type II toxin-antitoxin system VapC family toxin n=1 Tax=Candidatus Auribacter fodinae TaxID=2093366 RepID=A0A3A4R1M9_9BACT|nr:MAG: type II toxin-antitoxin system VapC family toxin [Candidatus Auribacter fodinae]